MLEANVPVDALKEMGDPGYPLFYLNYNLNPLLIGVFNHVILFVVGWSASLWFDRDALRQTAPLKSVTPA